MGEGRVGRRGAGACSIPGGEFDQVPEVPVEIGEHRDLAIGLHRGRADPGDARGREGGMIAIEIVGGEEQEDAPARLVADRGLLLGRGGAGKEDGGGVGRRAGRADRDPPLGRDSFGIAGALALFGDGRVLHQREAEPADVEGERFVIVADDQGDVGELGHGATLTLDRPLSICTIMQTVTYSEARENLKKVMDKAVADRAPVLITRQLGENVVMISAEEWAGMEETLHLMSSPANAKRLMEAVRGFEAGDSEAVPFP